MYIDKGKDDEKYSEMTMVLTKVVLVDLNQSRIKASLVK